MRRLNEVVLKQLSPHNQKGPPFKEKTFIKETIKCINFEMVNLSF